MDVEKYVIYNDWLVERMIGWIKNAISNLYYIVLLLYYLLYYLTILALLTSIPIAFRN